MRALKHSFALLLCLLLLRGALAEPQRILVIHSQPSCRIEDEQGQLLGHSGKPFQFSQGSVDTLKLVAEGYQAVEIQLSEVPPEAKRLPLEGTYQLAPVGSSPFPLMALLLCGLAVGGVLIRRRKSQEPSSSTNQQSKAPKFQMHEQIGQGGTALVFRATSRDLPGQDLAIKILKSDLAQDAENQQRFARSLESSMKLDHPNLIKLHDSGRQPDGSPYLLMERLQGESLEDFLRAHPRPDLECIRETLLPLCDVLGYLHGQGVVHRDVKPENIFLTRDGRVKLMDLETSKTALGEDLTKTGVAIGTPNYIAPEQARGEFCAQSDQYALGVLLFEMLTGELPFQGPDAITVIRRHIETPPPSLTKLVPGVTLLQQALTHRLLNKRPEQRFKNMSEVKQALLDALSPAADDATATSI